MSRYYQVPKKIYPEPELESRTSRIFTKIYLGDNMFQFIDAGFINICHSYKKKLKFILSLKAFHFSNNLCNKTKLGNSFVILAFHRVTIMCSSRLMAKCLMRQNLKFIHYNIIIRFTSLSKMIRYLGF